DLEEPAGPEGATVRHLLAHASGVAMDSDDTLSAPGRRRIYSNRGMELVADHVAEATGTDFADWLEDTVLLPLGLSTVVLEGSSPLRSWTPSSSPRPPPSSCRACPACCPASGARTPTTGAWASRSAARSRRTGPAAATHRRPSGTSASPAASCGSTRGPAWPRP